MLWWLSIAPLPYNHDQVCWSSISKTYLWISECTFFNISVWLAAANGFNVVLYSSFYYIKLFTYSSAISCIKAANGLFWNMPNSMWWPNLIFINNYTCHIICYLECTIYSAWSEHANHYTTDVVLFVTRCS
jgi:hypothetical protein